MRACVLLLAVMKLAYVSILLSRKGTYTRQRTHALRRVNHLMHLTILQIPMEKAYDDHEGGGD